MKIKLLIFFTINLLIINILKAQNDISLEDLKMPSSPAFILLDVAPTSIERPTNTKAFSTSVLNSINENNGIPQNYAMEFAPYWFFKHPKLTAFKYWGYDKTEDKRKPFSQAKFANISFAVVKTSTGIDSAINALNQPTNVAIGIRTNLLNLRSKKDYTQLKEANENHITRLSKLNEDPTISPIDLISKIESDRDLQNFNNEIQNILNRKAWLAIDFAAASSWIIKNNNYNSIATNRVGAWLTINLAGSLNKKDAQLKTNFINFYLASKFFNDKDFVNNGGDILNSFLWDNGGKVEAEFGEFSISYEYLYRWNLSDKNFTTFRSSGLAKYRVGEQVTITAAFGKNFGSVNNAITQIGINWGISKNQTIIPKKDE